MKKTQSITVFHNANIITTNPCRTFEALAFTAPTQSPDNAIIPGSILAIGSNREILDTLSSSANSIIDLKNATVLPTFTDSHIHLTAWAKQLLEPDLDGITSLQECLEAIKKALLKPTASSWLSGGGWNWNLWKESRCPTRHDLDGICLDTPIALKSKDWHTLWCNTEALKRFGIFDSAHAFKPNTVDVDENGTPTGLLREETAFHFMSKMPDLSTTEKQEAILLAQEKLFSLGITNVHSIESFSDFQILHGLAKQGMLALRVSCYILANDLEKITVGTAQFRSSNDSVHIAGLKLFTDGSLGSQTAFLLAPYANSESKGVCSITREQLVAVLRQAQNIELPCAIHAIGDAANRLALDAIEECQMPREETENTTTPINSSRLQHRIEHCQLVHPDDICRFTTLNVAASVQPTHLISDIDLVEKYWPDRKEHAYPFRSLKLKQTPLIFGSDAPVEPPSPFASLHAALTRTRSSDNKSLCPETQRLTFEESLAASTLTPAQIVKQDHFCGSISVGKYADIVCLEGRINIDDPAELQKQTIAKVYSGGALVWTSNRQL
jgi:predicted amidohydrolase YtcJ